MIKEKYVCYDSVDDNVSYHNTLDEALNQLKKCISEGYDDTDGLMYEELPLSFVAKITHKLEEVILEENNSLSSCVTIKEM